MKNSKGVSCKKTMKPGNVKDLPSGSMKAVHAGEGEILIVNPDSGIYALNNSCTLRGCKLSDGTLGGETVHCPCHGSVFNVKTGDMGGSCKNTGT
jgi:3-phenylpropionate/trans-cinnamate dioxygenase ferredoxin subunit